MNKTALAQIMTFLSQRLGLSSQQISPETNLASDGLLDSIALIEFLFFLEQHFSMNLDIEQIMQRPTPQGIARLLDEGESR